MNFVQEQLKLILMKSEVHKISKIKTTNRKTPVKIEKNFKRNQLASEEQLSND